MVVQLVLESCANTWRHLKGAAADVAAVRMLQKSFYVVATLVVVSWFVVNLSVSSHRCQGVHGPCRLVLAARLICVDGGRCSSLVKVCTGNLPCLVISGFGGVWGFGVSFCSGGLRGYGCDSPIVFCFCHPRVGHLGLCVRSLCISSGRLVVGFWFLGSFKSLEQLFHLRKRCVDCS